MPLPTVQAVWLNFFAAIKCAAKCDIRFYKYALLDGMRMYSRAQPPIAKG